jgi:hypothetical protein
MPPRDPNDDDDEEDEEDEDEEDEDEEDEDEEDEEDKDLEPPVVREPEPDEYRLVTRALVCPISVRRSQKPSARKQVEVSQTWRF